MDSKKAETKGTFLSLNVGIDYVGWAVTDQNYNLLRTNGQPAWGVTTFDQSENAEERRMFRSSRRRLDRKQERVRLVQDIFAKAIGEVDPKFFERIRESYLYREDAGVKYIGFADDDYSDVDFGRQYPSIHHLIVELMNSSEPHDVRLVYKALSWLAANRGHFFNVIDMSHISEIKDFGSVYDAFLAYFDASGFRHPWETAEPSKLGEILKLKKGVTYKTKLMQELLFEGARAPKLPSEDFPFSCDCLLKLLCGGSVKVKDLFCDDELADLGSIKLEMDEDRFAELETALGDENFGLISALRAIHDWSVLADILGNESEISVAKVRMYEQHKKDLEQLKRFGRKYLTKDEYNDVFHAEDGRPNYVAYSYHTSGRHANEMHNAKAGKEDFCKFLLNALKDVKPSAEDATEYAEMISRIEALDFCPKQRTVDNRVIPYQLYFYEYRKIIDMAAGYLPFIDEKDEDGYTAREKLDSIFTYRIPYYVGPLNPASKNAWVVRKPGKITPWNFKEMVDEDASEQAFIERLTGTCTYLPWASVLPKDSLLYHKFTLLNEINTISILGERISVELKQRLYNELFSTTKKVTRKKLEKFLVSNGLIAPELTEYITGFDGDVKGNLVTKIAFQQLMDKGVLTEEDVEKIILRSTYATDKKRLLTWLEKNYPSLNEADRKYICSIKCKDFGRLSKEFLTEVRGCCIETGEINSIMGFLYSTQNNLMELLSDRFTFSEEVERRVSKYYEENKRNLLDRLDDMYLNPTAKRSVYRALDVQKDIVKAFGKPAKIIIRTGRAPSNETRKRREFSRKQMILSLYAKCDSPDIPALKEELESLGQETESALQGDKLFLYFMQLGKDLYTGEKIAFKDLESETYDIDHIYPQAYCRDESVANNKVLTLHTVNFEKADIYPVADEVRDKMTPLWKQYLEWHLIGSEKYRRLTRTDAFSDDEKIGFITGRESTLVSAASKALATLLKESNPDAEVIYARSALTSDFRQEFDVLKCESYNGLYPAQDAYLNIVTANVYHERFTRSWFNPKKRYSLKTRTIYTHEQSHGTEVFWNGEEDLEKVIRTLKKNTALFTRYTFLRKGGLFDQMPLPKKEGLVPKKKGLDPAKYGGYNRPATQGFLLVKYHAKKKTDMMIMSVLIMDGSNVLSNEESAKIYCSKRIEKILGVPVSDISFPLGLRLIKVNTILSFDGFRYAIKNSGGAGKSLGIQGMMQFASDPWVSQYLKKLENLAEKIQVYKDYFINEKYDKVSAKKNLELYDLYISKLQEGIYRLRINNPVKLLIDGRDTFEALSLEDQTKQLLAIHTVFCQVNAGSDLSLIGGGSKAGATNISSMARNWAKNYESVRLIDTSPSGIWERKTDNLLDFLKN